MNSIRIGALSFSLALTCACTVQKSEPVSPGDGITATDGTVAVDPTHVPLLTGTCATGQLVARTATGWECKAVTGMDYSRFGACTGTQKVTGVDATTGAVLCGDDNGTQYTAGTGITLSNATVAVDPAVVPLVDQTCAAGSFVAKTASGWDCESAVSYTAGAGLKLTGTTLSLNAAGKACTGTDKVSGLDATGNLVCSIDVGGGASQWTAAGNDLYYSGGNVGIGTASPTAALQLAGNLSVALTGTVAVNAGSSAVTGTGTAFTTELGVGDAIKVGGEVFTVAAIASNTSLTLSANHTAGATNTTAHRDPNLLAVHDGAHQSRLVIDKSGNVGIGTTSPAVSLHVAGDAILRGTSRLCYTTGSGPAIGSVLTLDQSLVGGIGLLIKGNSPAQNWPNIDFSLESTSAKTIVGVDITGRIVANAAGAEAMDLVLSTKPTTGSVREAVRVTSLGNVGIGFPSPAARLDVLGTSTASGYDVPDGQADLEVFNTASSPLSGAIISLGAGFGPTGYIKATAENGAIGGIVIGNRRDSSGSMKAGIILRSNGNVGIGTASPAAGLDISTAGSTNNLGLAVRSGGPGWGSGVQFFNSASGGRTYGIYSGNDGKFWFGDVTASAERMVIDAGGNVGIGTQVPGYKLDVQGGDINAGGNVRASGAILTSDIRLKTDIHPLTGSLERILGLKAVTFRWKDASVDPDTQIGLIAQEVEKMFPEVVRTGKDGFKGVNYPALIAPVVESIKAQQSKIEQQQAGLNDLKGQNAALRAENQALRAQVASHDSRLAQLERQAKPTQRADLGGWLGLGGIVATAGIVLVARRRRGRESIGA